MAPPATPPPDPAVLIDDLIELFLLRLPPEDPATLACAALVSRQWYRVVTGPVFRRRLREFHGSPPLLGYISNIQTDIIHYDISFFPVSSFRPRHAYRRRRDVRAVHSSHGRVLLYLSPDNDLGIFLSVWDPITDEQRDLPAVPLPVRSGLCRSSNWDAAIICAVGDGCNHIHCHFKVVFVGRSQGRDFSCVYSSEADTWSDPIFASGGRTGYFNTGTCVHVGSAIYFMGGSNQEIFKYDLLTNQMSTIQPVDGMDGIDTMLIATEDGRLGVAKASNSTLGSTLHLWLREHGKWEERRAIELRTLLPRDALRDPRLPPEAFEDERWFAGFAETGLIFFKTRVGYFAVDLNSGRSKNIGKCLGWDRIIPYASFCTPTPAPGAVSTDDGSGDGVVVLTDEGPVAGLSSE